MIFVHPSDAPGLTWTSVESSSHAHLGAEVGRMSPELRRFFGAPSDAGILVQRIEPGSPAEAAKLAVGDVIVEVAGQRIERSSDVRGALASRPGETVEVVVMRNQERKTLKATLPPRPASPGFVLPTIPEIELSPELERHLSPEAREQLQRDLERAREQLREVERQLRSGALAPASPEPPEPPRRARKPKAPARERSKPRAAE